MRIFLQIKAEVINSLLTGDPSEGVVILMKIMSILVFRAAVAVCLLCNATSYLFYIPLSLGFSCMLVGGDISLQCQPPSCHPLMNANHVNISLKKVYCVQKTSFYMSEQVLMASATAAQADERCLTLTEKNRMNISSGAVEQERVRASASCSSAGVNYVMCLRIFSYWKVYLWQKDPNSLEPSCDELFSITIAGFLTSLLLFFAPSTCLNTRPKY